MKSKKTWDTLFLDQEPSEASGGMGRPHLHGPGRQYWDALPSLDQV
jgi:hypothetical protein